MLDVLLLFFIKAKVKSLMVLVRRHVDLKVKHIILNLVLFETKLYISYHFLLLVIDLEDFLRQLLALVNHWYPERICDYIMLLLFSR